MADQKTYEMIEKALQKATFPADKRQIIEQAGHSSEGKRSDVETLLNRLPAREFRDLQDLMQQAREVPGAV